MRFNSLTTACTVAVFPVPGTPEMSVEDDHIPRYKAEPRGARQHGVHTLRVTKGPSPSTLHQGRMHQTFQEEVLTRLVDAHGHKVHALSAVSERLKQMPHAYVVGLR